MPDFEAAGLTDAIGPEHFYPSVRLAVAAFDGQSGSGGPSNKLL